MSDLIPEHEAYLRAGGRADNTVACRVRRLHHAERHLPHGLDGSHTSELAHYLANPSWSRWTRHTYFNHLRGYYTWGVQFGHLSMDPMDAMIRPPEGDRLPDPCTDDELALALESLPMWPMGMAVRLAAYAGLRCCEITVACREKCTEERLRVLGKGGLVRSVAMSPILWATIKDLPPGPLCVGVRGRPITAKSLSEMQASFWRRIGLPAMHLHRLRHWFGTALLREGADLRTVQELMGHASITSTVGYTLIVDTQRRAAVRRLPCVEEHQPGSSRLVPTVATPRLAA
jgi:site-specific recombinase XerD